MKSFNYPVGRSNVRRERGNDLSTQEEYGVDHLAVSGDASLRHLLRLQRFSAIAHIGLHRSSLFCLFLVFSTSILYAWSPRIDVPRNYSAFSANAPSWWPCIHPSRSVQVWFRTLLLDLISSIFHFCHYALTMGLSLINERILSTAIVRHWYCRFLAANDTERPSSRNPSYAISREFSIVLDANKGFKTSQNSPGISLIASAPLGSDKPFVFSYPLSLSGIRFTEFCNCIFKVLNFVCCFFNRSDKFFAFNVIFNRKDNTYHRRGASDKCTQEHHIFPAVFVLVNIRQQEKNKKYCSCEDGIEDRFIEIFFEIRHFLFLRGLNRNLSLQTKFYSYPRRPLFLGALGKARALLAPRACLKTMLLQAFISRFIAWSQYLCIAKFSSHLFRTRSGRIGQRRCFLFLMAADCPKMIGENGGTKC